MKFENAQDYEHLVNQMHQYGFSVDSRTVCDLKRLVRMKGFNLIRALTTMSYCHSAADFAAKATDEVYRWQNRHQMIV